MTAAEVPLWRLGTRQWHERVTAFHPLEPFDIVSVSDRFGSMD